jgi:Alkylmercury lyase
MADAELADLIWLFEDGPEAQKVSHGRSACTRSASYEATWPSSSPLNFFATRVAAATWAASHPDISGGVLDQRRALQIGISIIGQLLS